MTVFKYALKRGIVSPVALIFACVLPIAFVVFGNFENEDSRGFYLVAFSLMVGAFFAAKGIQNDKIEGVVIRILAGPVTMRSYLVQNLLASLVPMAVLSLVIGGLGMVLHEWSLPLALGLAACYAFLAATSIGMSFVFSCLFKDKETSTGIFSAFITLPAMLGGFMIPLSVMPDVLFYLGAIFPAHWATRGIETLVVGEGLGIFWLSLLAMFLFSVAFLAYGGKRRIV